MPWSGPSGGHGVQEPALLRILQEEQARQRELNQDGPGGRPIEVDDRTGDRAAEDKWQFEAAQTPGILGPGDRGPDSNSVASLESAAMQPRHFTHGGEPYQFDPRVALGQELVKQQAARSGQEAAQTHGAMLDQQALDARVKRLVLSGYSEKEATRQVMGGPRTVQEEREIINTRSSAQLERDKTIQGDITARAQAAQNARLNVSMLLERSRSGDRQATRQLRAAQIMLQDATRSHAEAVRARQFNALGVDTGASPVDPEDAQLDAAIGAHLDDVQSTEAARRAAVAGVARAGATGAPGASGISDDESAAFLGIRTPAVHNDATGAMGASLEAADPMAKYHKAFQAGTLLRQTGPGQGLAPAKRPLEAHQHEPAAKDPGYAAWLQQKGYDVPASKPEDEPQGLWE